MFLLKPVFSILLCACFALGVSAQTTAFSFQGSLKDGAAAANGNYDFQFALYDAVTGGSQLGSTLTQNTVAVTNGIFSVSLDFGSQFPGANRFLEIRVKLSGGGTITTLAPRQPVNSAPYSVKSLNTDTASSLNCAACVTAAQIASVNGASITGTIPAASVPSGSSNYIQNGTAVQTANQNISGNAFFGGQVAIGTSTPSTNVKLQIDAGTNYGLFATATNDNAVSGVSTNGRGIYGQSTANDAVIGFTDGTNSSGVFGVNNGSGTNGKGVSGSSTAGTGVSGGSTSGKGVAGFSNSGYGLYGSSVSNDGVFGTSPSGAGVRGESGSSSGVVGKTNGPFGVPGVRGFSDGQGFGVLGESVDGVGVYGRSTNYFAAWFGGRVYVTGNLGVGVDFGAEKLTVQTATANYGLLHTDGTISVGSYVGGTNGGGWYGTKSNHPLSLFAGASGAALTVTTAGRVGIGTITPSDTLTVQTATTNYGMVHTDGTVAVGTYVGGSTGGGYFGTRTNHPLSFFTANGAPRMTITTAGLVGIGSNTPDQLLSVNGNASKAAGGTSWAVFSDERLKNIHGNFTTGLSTLMQLQPIRYQYKADNPLGLFADSESVGFSAQQVQRVLPEAVTTSRDGYLQLNSDPILWTMLNSIKEQQAHIDRQQKEIELQKNEIEALKSLVCLSNKDAEICRPSEALRK